MKHICYARSYAKICVAHAVLACFIVLKISTKETLTLVEQNTRRELNVKVKEKAFFYNFAQ